MKKIYRNIFLFNMSGQFPSNSLRIQKTAASLCGQFVFSLKRLTLLNIAMPNFLLTPEQ